MCDVLAQKLGKDVAKLIYWHVHKMYWQCVNTEYFGLLQKASRDGHLSFRDNTSRERFLFNYRSLIPGLRTWSDPWISRWNCEEDEETLPPLPKNY